MKPQVNKKSFLTQKAYYAAAYSASESLNVCSKPKSFSILQKFCYFFNKSIFKGQGKAIDPKP